MLKRLGFISQITCLFLGFSLLLGCQDDQSLSDYEAYDGPLRVLTNAVIEHSDSAVVVGKLMTPELHEFETGDRELPKGGFLEFFNLEGEKTSTLRSEYAYYSQEDEIWRIEGNVVLTNIESGESLNTEQLFWNPKLGDVYSDKFVRIEREDEILTGVGLQAKQDFSSYTIRRPQGVFNLED